MIKNVKMKLAMVFASIILVTSSFTNSDALEKNIDNSDNKNMTVYDGYVYQIKDNKAIVNLYEKDGLSLLVNDKVKKVFELKEEMNIYGNTYLEEACSIVEGNKNTDYILEFNFEKEDFEKVSMDRWIKRYKEIKSDILKNSEVCSQINNEEDIIDFDIDDGNINDGYIYFDISMKNYKSVKGIYKNGDILFNDGRGIEKELSDSVYVSTIAYDSSKLYKVDKNGAKKVLSYNGYQSFGGAINGYDITDDERYITIKIDYSESSPQVIVYENIDGVYEEICSTWQGMYAATISGNSILLAKNNYLDNKYINTEISEYSKGNLISTEVVYIDYNLLSDELGDVYICKYGEGILIEGYYPSKILVQKPNINIGWNLIDGNWYFYDNNGSIVTGWLNENGTWYYLNNSGAMVTGWLNENGTWYYLNSSGAMVTGWLNENGTWYYLNSSGAMVTGWLNENGTWYYLNNNGAMVTGWINLGGVWYYLDENGAMKTGWNYINNEWYYMYSSGIMATNCIIDGWKIDANGVAKL